MRSLENCVNNPPVGTVLRTVRRPPPRPSTSSGRPRTDGGGDIAASTLHRLNAASVVTTETRDAAGRLVRSVVDEGRAGSTSPPNTLMTAGAARRRSAIRAARSPERRTTRWTRQCEHRQLPRHDPARELVGLHRIGTGERDAQRDHDLRLRRERQPGDGERAQRAVDHLRVHDANRVTRVIDNDVATPVQPTRTSAHRLLLRRRRPAGRGQGADRSIAPPSS